MKPERRTGPTRQRGGILVAAGGALFVSLLLLGSADVGYFFYLKRDFQRTADMAAMAGAQWVEADDCQRALSSARGNAEHNLRERGLSLQSSPEPVCGRWDPDTSTLSQVLPSLDTAGGSGGQKFFGPPAPGEAYNAVQVSLQERLPSLIPLFGEREVFAEAIAVRQAPVASFSIGSRLLSLHEGSPLHLLLRSVGLDANQIDVLSSAGLANVNVTPAGLLQALGLPATAILDVGTANEAAVLSNLTLGAVLNATAEVLSQSSGAGAQLAAVQALQAQLSALPVSNPLDLPLRLFGSDTENGIFAHLTAPDKLAALAADVDVLSLVTTSLALANKDHFLNLSSLELPSGPLNGLLQAKLRVIEPPAIAIGGIGTTAYSAQTRLFLRVSSSGSPVGSLLGLLGIKVDLPIIVEAVTSQGELTAMCSAPLEKGQAVIDVHSAAGRVCIGGFPGMENPEESAVFSSQNSCTSWVEDHKVLELPLISPVRSGPISAHLDQLLASSTTRETLTAPEQRTITPNDNIQLSDLGYRLAAAVGNGIVDQLLGGGSTTGLLSGVKTDGKRGQVARELLGEKKDYPAGKSLSAVQWELRTSAESLERFAKIWTSGYVLSGLLSLVDGLLGTIGALVGDVVCSVAWLGGPDAVYECKVPLVKGMLAGDSIVTAVLSVIVKVLEPVLDLLSALLQTVLNKVLGLGIGETDVALHSVQCGQARLVY